MPVPSVPQGSAVSSDPRPLNVAGAAYIAGAQGLVFKGAWSAVVTYVVGDVVTSGGSSYVALASSLNDAPPSSNWAVIASKGDTGSTGATGAAGPAGADGAAGPQGPAGPLAAIQEAGVEKGTNLNTLNFTGATVTVVGTTATIAITGAIAPMTLTAPTATDVPLTLKGAAAQTGYMLEVRDSGNALRAHITQSGYYVTKAGILVDPAGYVEADFFQSATVYGAVPLTYMALVADGGSAVGHVLESYATGGVALANASAKLLSIRNGGVEKAYFGKDGMLKVVNGIKIDGNVLYNSSSAYINFGGDVINLTANVTDGAASVSHVINNTTSLVTSGAKLLSIRNANVEKAYFDKDGKLYAAEFAIPSGGSSLVSAHVQLGNLGAVYGANSNPGSLIGKYNDGASAVGTVLDNAYALSTSGAKLVSIRNAGTEKAYFDKDGNLYVGGSLIGGASAPLLLTAPAATDYALKLKMASAQTAHIFRIHDSLDNAKLWVDSSGYLYSNTGIHYVCGGNVYTDNLVTNTAVSQTVTSTVADGASAVAVVLKSSNTFTTAGAKLLSVKNNATEKFYVGYNGNVVGQGDLTFNQTGSKITGYDLYADNSAYVGNLFIRYNAQAIYAYDTDSLRLFGRCSNGATAIAVILDNNTYSLSTAGAKLVSIRNASTEKAYIDKDGLFFSGGNPLGRKVSVPATATSAGTVGDWAVDSSYVYFCTATNTWVRAAVATW